MKPKISPEEYRSILETLELSSISQIESSTKLIEDNIAKSLSLVVDEKYTFSQVSNTLNVQYSYKLIAKGEDDQDPAMTITARYSVKYRLSREIAISKDFMKIFSDLTIGMLLWPYFREFVNNVVYRMGMPPLVLGLKKK